MKQILLGIVVFAVFFGATAFYVGEGGTAGGIGPDSVLYTLDTIAEWVQVNVLTRSESKKVQLKLQFMQERLDELSDLERLKTMSKDNTEKIKERYTELANDVTESITNQAKEAVDAHTKLLAEQAKGVVAEQQKALIQILEKAPDPVKDPLTNVLNTANDAYKRAVELIGQTQ